METIGTVAVIILIVVILAGLSMETKLARANRIARATHDLIKAILDEQKKANELLEKIATRTGRIASPPVPPIPPGPATTPKAEADVYKI